jgi:N-acetylneuraminic acid mutarotase
MKIVLLLFLLITTSLFSQGNSWRQLNDFLGGQRERAVAFAIGDYGYLGTGVDTAEQVLKDLWRYDPVMDSWTQMADLPGAPRRDAIGFSAGGKGYIGLGVDNHISIQGNKKKDLWEFDPILNSWLQKADYPGGGGNGAFFSTVFVTDEKAYVCGGKIGPNLYINQLWEYKPSADAWTERAPFPGGVRYLAVSFSINGSGYVGMGANQDVYKKDFYKFNPGSNSWSAIAPFPAYERGSASAFAINGRGYVCLGTNGGLLDDLIEYNPVTNTWAIRASYGGSPRKNAVAFVLHDKAYVGTGKGYDGKRRGMQEYSSIDFLGLDEQDLNSLLVYPNPTNGAVHLNQSVSEHSTIMVFDVLGNIVLESDADQEEINLINLPKGNYILKLTRGNIVLGSTSIIKN